MTKDLTVEQFENFAQSLEAVIGSSPVSSPKLVSASPEAADEPRPKSAREIAEEYSISDRQIQEDLKVVRRAYPWLEQKQLKIGVSAKTRYTPLCQQLLAQFRASDLTAEDWIEQVWQSHPVESAPFRSDADVSSVSPPPVMPDQVLPPQPESVVQPNLPHSRYGAPSILSDLPESPVPDCCGYQSPD